MMSDIRYKLHPVSALLNFLKGLKELIVPFILVFGVNLFRGDGISGMFSQGWEGILPLLIGIVLLLFLLIGGIVKWKRFVYWFEEGELRIEYGLFVKKKRYIPFDRIQSLNYTEGIFHRPLGLVKVRVETAGGKGDGAEAELTAISKSDADRIAVKMEEAKRGSWQEAEAQVNQQQEPVKKLETLYRMTMKELLVLATTSGGIGVVISGVAVFLSQFMDLIPYESIYNEVMLFLRFGILVVVLTLFVGLLIAWAVSVALTIFANYQFTLQRDEDTIYITRGLLEKKKLSVPFKRVQGIKVSQNPFRQLFGYATVTVESAGGALNEGKEEKIRLFPLIKKADMYPVMKQLFPEMDWSPELIKAPKRSVHFFYRLDLFWLLPVVGTASYFLYPYGLFALLLIPAVIMLRIWQHRSTGFAITGRQLTMEYRTISKHTAIMLRKRIQVVEVSQSVFQRKRQIASVESTIKSGLLGTAARIEHMDIQDADYILEWFKPSEAEAAKKGQPDFSG